MSEEMVPVYIVFGEQEHLPNNQFIVKKESIMINAVTIQQTGIFSYGVTLFPNAKLYCINWNTFDKHNQCLFLLLVETICIFMLNSISNFH